MLSETNGNYKYSVLAMPLPSRLTETSPLRGGIRLVGLSLLLLKHPTGAVDGTMVAAVDHHGVWHGVHGKVSGVGRGIHD